jgi:hypothetical protein
MALLASHSRLLACSLLIAGCLGLLHCAETPLSVAEGPREYVAIDYPQVLRRWTRDKTLVSLAELDSPLTVTATYEAWDFRWAYVIRYAQDYRLTIDQRKVMLDKSLEETRESHCFYVALYGSSLPKWTDLSKKTSGWVVRLVDDKGNESAPATLEKTDKPGLLERRYFPYTSPWRQVFRIKFARTNPTTKKPAIAADAEWVGLRFAGPEGNQELHWDLAPSAKP